MTAILSALLALARAIPALESLFRLVIAERDKEREGEAARRLVEKDATVDRAFRAKEETPAETQK